MPTDELIAINGGWGRVGQDAAGKSSRRSRTRAMPLTATFVLGERREGRTPSRRRGGPFCASVGLPEVSAYVKEAQSHRAIAADGQCGRRWSRSTLRPRPRRHRAGVASTASGGRSAVNVDFHTGRRQKADQQASDTSTTPSRARSKPAPPAQVLRTNFMIPLFARSAFADSRPYRVNP